MENTQIEKKIALLQEFGLLLLLLIEGFLQFFIISLILQAISKQLESQRQASVWKFWKYGEAPEQHKWLIYKTGYFSNFQSQKEPFADVLQRGCS